MVISMEEKHKTPDIKKQWIKKLKNYYSYKMKWRPIYEVTDTSFFAAAFFQT